MQTIKQLANTGINMFLGILSAVFIGIGFSALISELVFRPYATLFQAVFQFFGEVIVIGIGLLAYIALHLRRKK
jgi:hypothetical protein